MPDRKVRPRVGVDMAMPSGAVIMIMVVMRVPAGVIMAVAVALIMIVVIMIVVIVVIVPVVVEMQMVAAGAARHRPRRGSFRLRFALDARLAVTAATHRAHYSTSNSFTRIASPDRTASR